MNQLTPPPPSLQIEPPKVPRPGIFLRLVFGVYAIVRKITGWVVYEVSETGRLLVLRARKIQRPDFRSGLGVFLLLSVLSVGFVRAGKVLTLLEDVKNKVMNQALSGGEYLEKAKSQIRDKDLSSAENSFLLAQAAFKNSRGQLESANATARGLLDLIPQKRDAEDLLEASSEISKAGRMLVEFYDQSRMLEFSLAGLTAKEGQVPEILNNANLLLGRSLVSVKIANSKLSRINPSILPEGSRPRFGQLKDQVSLLQTSLEDARALFAAVTEIFSGNKNLLLVMQNNNELRPTGGFVGTYGAFYINEGRISGMQVRSIYDLDGQLNEKISPPSPLLAVNDRWYMRDSNWFADFPQSARKISTFYEKEGGETPDVVVGVTASFVQDLLDLAGPVQMPAYNLTLDGKNFVERMQAASTISEGGKSSDPKKIIADFMPLLLEKLSAMPPEKKTELLEIVRRNLAAKNLIIYSRNSDTQSMLESFNWAGKIQEADRDYLSVVAANLGGTKTDLSIKQNIRLTSSLANDGSVTNTLEIERENLMPADLEYGINKSFLRILVPEGSQLLAASGFDLQPLPEPDTKNLKTDSDLQTWENSIKRDVVTGTLTGREAGKTFFGNWVILKGGEKRTVRLQYRLPFKVAALDRFSLLVQKQPGAETSEISYDLSFSGRNLVWKNFDTSGQTATNIKIESELNRDLFWGLILQDRN